MKQRIAYSAYVKWLTAIITLALAGACAFSFKELFAFCAILSVLLILVILTLLYGAWAVEADPRYIKLASPLKSKKLPMRDVQSAERFQPTLGAVRLLGSGGYLGYWGIFKEGDIGRYYAFYGKASDCFIVRMKNGDKYVLGCNNPDRMVEYILSQLQP